MILTTDDLFWQYPVITEKVFCEQNKQFSNYIGVPWATVIDKNINLNTIYNILSQNLNKSTTPRYTCCQHIHFRRLIPLFESLNITRLYTSHKLLNEDTINNVLLKPCPLYAVNFEDTNRNTMFTRLDSLDMLNINRPNYYSFVGAYMNHYISDIRKQIFDMKHEDDCVVSNTGSWHFESQVYSSIQNSSRETTTEHDSVKRYNDLLLSSKFSLCPSGAGPNSIRLWESLACGAIPVILADDLELPRHDLWNKSVVRIKECDVHKLSTILRDTTNEQQRQMRINCFKLYNHFKNNYTNDK